MDQIKVWNLGRLAVNVGGTRIAVGEWELLTPAQTALIREDPDFYLGEEPPTRQDGALHRLTIYRGAEDPLIRSTCERAVCGHSICILLEALRPRLHRARIPCIWKPWRPDLDTLDRFPGSATFEIGNERWAWIHFDNSLLPRHHVQHLSQNFTGALVCSQYFQVGLANSGFDLTRTRRVRYGIDPATFTREGDPVRQWGDDFLFFHGGALCPRKGTDVAIRAFCRTFTKDDPVRLLLKNYNYGEDAWVRDLVDQARQDPQAPALEYIYDTWTPLEMAALYRRVAQHGAGFFPIRVEGFGLIPLEMLACGARVGITGYSGPCEYLPDFTAPDLTAFPYRESPSHHFRYLYQDDEGPHWAEPEQDALGDWLRDQVATPGPASLESSRQVAEHWNYEPMAKSFLQALGLGTPPAPAPAPGEPVPTPIVVSPSTIGVGIPTRDRWETLAAGLAALLSQTRLPTAVIMVIDGSGSTAEHPAVRSLLALLKLQGVRVAEARGPGQGAAFGHQIALRALDTDYILRLDDDVLLPPGALARFADLLDQQPGVGAVGGCWVSLPEWTRPRRVPPGPVNSVAALLQGDGGVQFFPHQDPELHFAEHLYSSWMYRRAPMLAVGGFPECYSRFGQREETDASVRLHLAGWALLVDPSVQGAHLSAPGGRREFASQQAKDGDEALFRQRYLEWIKAR